MPLQNRVTPLGEIIADPARGTLMGNRGGALHLPDRSLGTRRWISRQWIACRLAFNNRRRTVMSPGRYTELFFLDESTAYAAGHRPCFECRRTEAEQFATLWSAAAKLKTRASAGEIDRALHAERLDASGKQRRHAVDIADLPDGTMILDPSTGLPALVLDNDLLIWSISGYSHAVRRPRTGTVTTLTPPSITGALKLGYRPKLHESAYDPR